jgi:hypothetical protein
MNLYSSSAKCLKFIRAPLLFCLVSFLCACILPFTDPRVEQCAAAAIRKLS